MRVTEFNVGQWCLSEDECISAGINFAAYERGVADAAKAFGKNVATQAEKPFVWLPETYLTVGSGPDGWRFVFMHTDAIPPVNSIPLYRHAASPSPQDFTLPMVEEGKGADGVALPEPPYCPLCGNTGHAPGCPYAAAGVNAPVPAQPDRNALLAAWHAPEPVYFEFDRKKPKPDGFAAYTVLQLHKAFADGVEAAAGVAVPRHDPTSPRTTDGGAA